MLKPSEGTGNMYAAADDKVGQLVNLGPMMGLFRLL